MARPEKAIALPPPSGRRGSEDRLKAWKIDEQEDAHQNRAGDDRGH